MLVLYEAVYLVEGHLVVPIARPDERPAHLTELSYIAGLLADWGFPYVCYYDRDAPKLQNQDVDGLWRFDEFAGCLCEFRLKRLYIGVLDGSKVLLL